MSITKKILQESDLNGLPMFEDYKFSFEEKMINRNLISWYLYAFNKKTGEKTFIGRLKKDSESYNTDGGRIDNKRRIIYNYHWDREGLVKIFGREVTSGSKRIGVYDFYSFSSYAKPSLKYFVNTLKEIFSKYGQTQMNESYLVEIGVLDTKITNPETGHKIKVSSALGYDEDELVYKKAKELVQKKSPKKPEDKKSVKPKVKATGKKSFKPKAQSFGVSKECVAFLKSKGYSGLSVLPQSFVKPEEIEFNPLIEKKGKDATWICKFPSKDKKGNTIIKTAYTHNFMKKSQVKKYKKISKIKNSDIEKLDVNTLKLMKSKSKNVSDAGCVLRIILKTGLRPGSQDNSETGNIGVRTLKASNVTIKGDKIRLHFIGKSYQENIAEFSDPDIAEYLSKNIKGKGKDDNVFDCSYGEVVRVMKKINPKGIKPKDLRTYKAGMLAKKLLQSTKTGPPPPLPENPKEIKKTVKQKLVNVFTKVADFLNNTPTMAKSSYVHPVIIMDYLSSLGLTPKEVNYKHITIESKILENIALVSKFLSNKEVFKKELDKLKQLKEAEKNVEPKWTTMDEMFEKFANYGEGIDYSDISDEDMNNCEEYTLPDWWDDENIDLVKS